MSLRRKARSEKESEKRKASRSRERKVPAPQRDDDESVDSAMQQKRGLRGDQGDEHQNEVQGDSAERITSFNGQLHLYPKKGETLESGNSAYSIR